MSRNGIIKVTLAVAIAVTISIGSTLAFMSNMATDPKTNKFNVLSGNKDLTAQLTETQWDATKALNIVPGTVVNKNPVILNTTGSHGVDPTTYAANGSGAVNPVTEWAAAKVTFFKGDGVTPITSAADLATLWNVITINWNTTDWVIKTGETNQDAAQTWYYKTNVLAAGGATNPLFTTVTINSGATVANLNIVTGTTGTGWNGFIIHIDGAVVQGDISATYNAAMPELDALLP